MEGALLGGILGLIGVGVSLIFNFKLNKRNNKFQEKLNEQSHIFQEQLQERQKEFDLWKEKYSVLVTLISYRYNLQSNEYTSAMNSIPAVFHDSKEVMTLTKRFYAYQSSRDINSAISNEKLSAIFSAMFKDLGIDENIDETFLSKTFNAK